MIDSSFPFMVYFKPKHPENLTKNDVTSPFFFPKLENHNSCATHNWSVRSDSHELVFEKLLYTVVLYLPAFLDILLFLPSLTINTPYSLLLHFLFPHLCVYYLIYMKVLSYSFDGLVLSCGVPLLFYFCLVGALNPAHFDLVVLCVHPLLHCIGKQTYIICLDITV